MRRRVVGAVAVTAALLLSACGASGGESGSPEREENEAPAEEKATANDAAMFGEMDEPVCGDGDFSVEPSEAGGSPDVLRIGVPTDRSAQLRPGLNKEMWDAGVAFSEWCNDLGGVGGLQIELVDIDAALFDVEAAMTKACDSVFALVGGGLAQDQLMFSGKPGSDFHECELIDIPGFNNSPEKANSNGQVQPVPNPGSSHANTWIRDFAALYPEEAANMTVIWADLPSLEQVRNTYVATAEVVDEVTMTDGFSYPAIAVDDWTPYAERLKASGATSFIWVGEPGNLVAFMIAARNAGWEGRPLLETNMYDPTLTSAGAALDGVVVKTAFHPMEEADKWPAVRDYLDMIDSVPDGKTGALGMQGMSAWLLFVTAANECGEKNDGVLDRTCVLEQAAAVDEWTGGGLHSAQSPDRYDEMTASPCQMLLVVRDGTFERLWPELDSDEDDGDGFHCGGDDAITEIPGGADSGVVDPDRPI